MFFFYRQPASKVLIHFDKLIITNGSFNEFVNQITLQGRIGHGMKESFIPSATEKRKFTAKRYDMALLFRGQYRATHTNHNASMSLLNLT